MHLKFSCPDASPVDLVNGNSFLVHFYVIYTLPRLKKRQNILMPCPTPGQYYHLLWE